MVLPWPSLAVAALLALGAALLLVASPERRAHVALVVALVLRAGVMATGSMAASAGSGGTAMAYARTSVWFSLLVPLSTFALATLLFPRRRDRWAGIALAGLTGVALAIQALRPEWVINGIVDLGAGRYAIDSAYLLYVLGALSTLVDALLVWRASRAAAKGAGALASRAAALGAAFALFPLYSAANFVGFLPGVPTPDAASVYNGLFYLRAGATIVGGAIILMALPRLVAPLDRRARLGALGLAGAIAALGFVDAITATGRLVLPGYQGGIVFVRVSFALLLLAGALRFGLADAGLAARRRVLLAVRGIVAVALASLFLALGPLLLGANVVGAVAGIAFGGAIGAVAWRPLDRPARWAASRLLLAADDARAVAERARRYAAAVAASKDAGAEGERLLAALRVDLDITQREHEILAEGIASREKERYTRIEGLGAGATANVELALDEVAGRKVVVKRFKGLRDPAQVLREARTLAAVRHPRVVPFLEVDRRDDEVYLVIAYAEGGSARQLLDKEGALPPARAVGLALDLLDGLDALHEQGIVHCDVKAENLLLDRDGRGLLGDFGSARFSAPDLADATLAGGDAEGSLSTISPEALRGAKPAPSRDVYAAGALLYRLLTGQHYVALGGATVFEARERILLDAPRLPHPKVPASIEAVLLNALAKKPEMRYPGAREMRDALAVALARS